MASKKFEMLVAFNLMSQLDKPSADKAFKSIEKMAKDMKIEIDPAKAKQGINEIIENFKKIDIAAKDLDKVFKDYEVFLDTDVAKKAMKDIEKMVKGADLGVDPFKDLVS